jgi:hypothetical protein
MVDSAAEARLRAEARARTAAMKADADPLAALQKSVAESKAQVEKKNIEIPTIALEQAVNTGDTDAIRAAATELGKAQGLSGSALRTFSYKATQDAAKGTKPTPPPADANFTYDYVWRQDVGGPGGNWVLIKSPIVGGTTTASTTTSKPVITTSEPVITKSGLTQADIDAAVAKAVAGATAANNAMIAQMKAEADAAKLATKQKASDKLTALFSAYGLETLAPFINTRIMADVSEEMLLLELYDRPEYQKRFPGMSSLRKKSRTITEKEYMDIEKAMTQTARFFDLPKGFYDNPDDFGKLIGAEVSAKEYQDRLQVGQDLSRTLNPSVKQQLIDFYGVGEGDLTAFVLDADKALPLIQKQAKAAQFVGIGRAAGFELRGITSGQAENIAGTESYAKLSERELAQALGQAGQLRRTQKRLSGIEGQDYSEQEALSAVIEGSPQALLASQQRAQREGARFSARGGVTGASLRSTATPI